MVTKEMVEPLLTVKKELSEKLTNVNTAIRALQDICEHDWKNDGHDSHKDHFICKICSRTDSW